MMAYGTQILLALYFYISTLGVISSCILQRLNSLTIHGKLCKNRYKLDSKSCSYNSWIAKRGFFISKKWFSYFYLLGTVTTVLCIYQSYPTHNRLNVFLLHLIRRLFEEVLVTNHSTKYSEMSIFAFIFGLSYYILMPITVMDIPDFNGKISIFQLVLFGICSFFQYNTHLILSEIRGKNSSIEYGIPYGGLFRFISCPHYLCEIGIYLSLFIDIMFQPEALHIRAALSYVITCMYINAVRTHNWYINNFYSYLKLNRKAIIPFII
ncbi:putative polyprenol reductase [Cryptosporidium felis]|nr:putative polyprenol reductase [Cryptosporidium felis]